jgi:hypothetical protein
MRLNVSKGITLKRKWGLTAAFVLALLLSALASAMFVNLAEANPGPVLFFPEAPETTLPTIVFHSPVQNQTYDSTGLWLNFTIVKPEAWFPDRGWDVGNYIFVNITSVYYVVNGGQRQDISVHDVSSLFDASQTRNLPVSTNLTLTEGTHEVKVLFEADSYYVISYQEGNLSSVKMHGESEPVSFTVLQQPQLEPQPETERFPATFVAAVSGTSVAIIGVALLVYFRRRSHRPESLSRNLD